MFMIFLVAFPVACTTVPFVLGRSGRFNPSYQAWNNVCGDPKFTSMFHLQYLAAIGNSFSVTMYARDTSGVYHYLGLLPTTQPGGQQFQLTTPNFILFPTTNPVIPNVVAGQQMFTINTNDSTALSQLIASVQLNVSDSNIELITAMCVNSTNTGEQTNCVSGALLAGSGNISDPVGENPFLRGNHNRTETLKIVYDILPPAVNSTNSTFLTGYLGSWPSNLNSFMTGNDAASVGPNESLQITDSQGVVLEAEGVRVVGAPWPGCGGLVVCSTTGLDGMIVAGWVWENLNNWMWYSPQDCQT
jgi:hypothetical protein